MKRQPYIDRGLLSACFLNGADLPSEVVDPVMECAGAKPVPSSIDMESFVRRAMFSPSIALSATVELLSDMNRGGERRITLLDHVFRDENDRYSGVFNDDPKINAMIARVVFAKGKSNRELAWFSARGILKAFRVASHFDHTLAFADREAALLWEMARLKATRHPELCELIRRDFWRHPAVRYSYAGVFSTNGRPSKTPRRPRFVANFDFDKVLS